jgi:hypothetical protein
VLADAATAGNTATMTADGRYTKIGRLITVECRMLDIDTTGMTAGNNIFIRGLPEVVSANSRAIGSVSLDRVNFTNYVVVVGGANTSYALLSDQIDSDQDVVLTVAAITSTGSDITFTLQYTKFNNHTPIRDRHRQEQHNGFRKSNYSGQDRGT